MALTCLTGAARADLSPLADRCPPNTNAVIAVDSAHLMTGPLAKRLGWVAAAGANGAAGAPRADSPLPFVGVADALLLAMQWDVGQMEPAWELTLVYSGRGGPAIEALATANGGYVDPVAGKPAAWFANDTGVVRLDERTIGLFRPADRQLVARWVRNTSVGRELALSEYLRRAAAQAGEASPVVVAIDLADAIGEVSVRRALERGSIAALSGTAGAGDPEMPRLLAGTRGATLVLSAADPPRARLVVDFGADAARVGEAAKPLVLEVMAESGLSFPDMRQWTYAVKGQAIIAVGSMYDVCIGGLFCLLDTSLHAGGDAQTVADRAAAARQAPDASQRNVPAVANVPAPGGGAASAAAASQQYFRSVSAILERLKPGTSLGDSAAWLARDARRIDMLPSAGVDPDLLAWGASVSAKLRESAAVFSAGQQRVRAASASAQVPAAYAPGGSGYGDAQQAAQARADRENARRQARQAAAEEHARAATEGARPLQEALDSRAKVRAEMARKYGVDF
jgi:hypothetical protein